MARTWYDGDAIEGDIESALFHHDIFPDISAPCTLLRTMIWWSASCVADAPTVSNVPLMQPLGWFLQDGNSRAHPGPPQTGFSAWSIDKEDVIAAEYSNWDYTPVAWGGHIGGGTTGNIFGGQDYDLTIATQKLVYIRDGGFVDSHAQRKWFSPHIVAFTLNADTPGFDIAAWSVLAPIHFWARVRFLFEKI